MKKILVGIFVLLLIPIISNASLEKNSNSFLVISDIHLDSAPLHNMEIAPSYLSSSNDLDQTTFETMMSRIKNNIDNGTIDKPKFIMILGDILGHTRTTAEAVVNTESTVFRLTKTTFPNIPILYVFGNNDSLAINYGPFKDPNNISQITSPFDVATTSSGWKNGFLSTGQQCKAGHPLFPCMITQNVSNGYYSTYLSNKLRLISLNSVLFAPRRTQVSALDAANQLAWLESQLKIAEAKNESVLLAMHIPPGNNVFDHSNFWLAEEQDQFLKLVDRYQHTIIGLLAGHTHAEELKVIKNHLNETIAGVYFTAALSTSHGNEPSVKSFYFSKANKQWLLTDYKTFHFSDSNSILSFNKLYDYDEYYCPALQFGLFNCLNYATPEKISAYYTAGNINYSGIIQDPEDFNLVEAN